MLFNDTLNTFYLQLYGVGHMVKDHSDSERGNLLPPLAVRDVLYTPSHRQCSTNHDLRCTNRGALAGTINKLNGSTMKDRSDDPSHHERIIIILPQCYASIPSMLALDQVIQLKVTRRGRFSFSYTNKLHILQLTRVFPRVFPSERLSIPYSCV